MDEVSAKRLATILFQTDDISTDSQYPMIPGYAIDSLLGQGGGGVVYRGTLESTGRPVAIKVLHPYSCLNARDALREIDRLAQIRSIFVPHVLDFGLYQNQVYIVTELIDGADPLTYSAKLKTKDRVKLLIKIADAVSVLHARGVIHRDIKPSNILITANGTPVLLDLGIAAFDADEGEEPDGIVRGTNRYMSPEQASGRNSESTTKWDVYALGILSLEILLGDDFDPASDPQTLFHLLPKRLRRVLSTAISRDPELRYETSQLFRDDLEAWLKHQPTYADRKRLWARMFRLFSASPILSFSLFGILILSGSIAVSFILVLWQNTTPYRFETIQNSGGQSILTLYSLNGRIIRQWEVESANTISKSNQLIHHQGRELAVIGLGGPDNKTKHRGLVIYETGKWNNPLWCAEQQVTPEMAHVTRFEQPPHLFRYVKHYLLDIFPSENGDEIVSIHRHVPSSLCAIQIHSLEGKLLSEYYHDGWLVSAVWLPNQERLVLAGQNSDGAWEDRGGTSQLFGRYPMVIFAITPELGSVGNTIAHPGLNVGTPADWYRFLSPPDAYHPFGGPSSGPFHGIKIAPKPDKAADGVIQWQLGGMSKDYIDPGHVTLEISQEGKLIEAWCTDNWVGEKDYGLSPGMYKLEELPPRIKPRDHEPRQPPDVIEVRDTP